MPDFRVASYLEAQRCLALVRKQSIEEPTFWANLLGGILNATAACVPDSVMVGVHQHHAREEARRDAITRHLQEQLAE